MQDLSYPQLFIWFILSLPCLLTVCVFAGCLVSVISKHRTGFRKNEIYKVIAIGLLPTMHILFYFENHICQSISCSETIDILSIGIPLPAGLAVFLWLLFDSKQFKTASTLLKGIRFLFLIGYTLIVIPILALLLICLS